MFKTQIKGWKGELRFEPEHTFRLVLEERKCQWEGGRGGHTQKGGQLMRMEDKE